MKRSSFITWDQLKVGALVGLALVVLAFAVYKLGQAANLFHRRYELVAYLSDANGLMVGGPVTVAGQTAGVIKDISFLPVDVDTSRNLKLTLSIDQTLQPQIRRDSKARVRTMGLLGDKLVDITPGTPRYTQLRAGDTLTITPSLDYETVLAQAAGAVTDMVDLTHDLRQITGRVAREQRT